jgi:sugar porter (SP) family MFS transporter
MIALVFVPETPAHYLSQKRYREARESLEWLRGGIHVDQEYEDILKSVEESATQSAGLTDLLSSSNLAPFIISLWLMLGQQFSGMNAVMFYCVSIFEQSGSSLNSNTENIIVGAVQIVATIFAALVMDKAGRRILLNLSSSVMVISIGVLGMFFFIANNPDDKTLAEKIDLVPVASLSLFVFAFSVGFGPIPWLMMSELFSPEVKSLASSISTSFNWTLAFLVTKFFSTMVNGLTEAGAFWFFGSFTILTFLFCMFFVPETKGKSLDEIQHLFRSDRPYFYNIGIWRACGGRGSQAEDRRPIVEEEVY